MGLKDVVNFVNMQLKYISLFYFLTNIYFGIVGSVQSIKVYPQLTFDIEDPHYPGHRGNVGLVTSQKIIILDPLWDLGQLFLY